MIKSAAYVSEVKIEQFWIMFVEVFIVDFGFYFSLTSFDCTIVCGAFYRAVDWDNQVFSQDVIHGLTAEVGTVISLDKKRWSMLLKKLLQSGSDVLTGRFNCGIITEFKAA